MDNVTLEKLMIKEMAVIYKYLMKMGATKEDAEDIVQETLYQAVRYRDTLYGDRIFNWLFKVAVNKYYNLYNKKARKPEVSLDDQAVSRLVSHQLVEATVINAELGTNIKSVLESLKESYRNLIVLRYVLGLSYRELAGILGVNEDRVKTYLYRARNKFREIWEEAGYDK